MTQADLQIEERPKMQATVRGFFCRCPNCNEGKLFRAFLKPVDNCSECGEDFTHHRSDDFPPYINIMIVGHIVVALVLLVEKNVELTLTQHLLIWLPLTIVMSIVLMQPIKGAVIGIQWAMRMFGFGDPENADKY